jgi:opacity protein-like surface antigen
MKKITFALAAVAAFSAAPAMADSFTGHRVTGTVGYQDITNIPSDRSFTYGAEFGYDLKLAGPVTVGVEAGVDNVFDRADINVGARVGYEVNKNTLVYAGLGYDNLHALEAHNLQGLRATGGIDFHVVGPISVGAQYTHTDLGAVKNNGVAGTVTFRF